MLLNTFYTQVALGNLTAEGFAALVNKSASQSNAFNWWKEVLFWVGRHGGFFAPIMGPLLVATAVSAILLMVRGITALVATAIFAVFWVSLWAVQGIWIFEFLFPLLFAAIVTLATLPQFFDASKPDERILGAKIFGNLSPIWRLVILILTGALLWYIVILSENAGALSARVAWQSSITFIALFAVTLFVDRFRAKPTPYKSGFRAIDWTSVMILCVGAMMVIQVLEDAAFGWYTVEGYAGLVQLYAKTSNAPEWFRAFLRWSGDHALFWMPVQAVFEPAVAILLPLLILRGPIIVLTTGMLITFNYAEFGVAASVAGGPDVTGTWELSFVNIALIFVCIRKLAQFIQASSWKERIFGERLFGNLHLLWCLLIALLGGAGLFFAGWGTHVTGSGYLMISWIAGVAFAILLGVNALIDKSPLRSEL